jgi:LSD1 subclass zinc finger protein
MTALCLAGRRCVTFDRRSDCPGVAVRNAPLCSGCLGRARADVAALPSDYRALAAELLPAGRAGSARVTGGDEDAPVPLALHIEALQRRIVWTLTTWEPPVREAAGLPAERSGPVRDAWAVSQAAALLAPRVDVFAALGPTWGYADGLDAGPVLRDGVYGLDTLCALHRVAEQVTGRARRTRRLPGECSGCRAWTLLREDGSDTVRCGTCQRRWTYDEYRQYVGLLLAAQ